MEEITKYPKSIPSPNVEPKDENIEENFHNLDQVKTQHGIVLGKYQGFWFNEYLFKSLMSVHKYFQAKDNDIILASFPKSGTTWLKALAYSIINRPSHSGDYESPLLFSNPHELVPFLENSQFKDGEKDPNVVNYNLAPRIFATHIPYSCLPKTILQSKSKIVYLYRNPMDVFTSSQAFIVQNGFVKLSHVEEEFQLFCDGIQSYGPFWDHILGYWNQSLKTNNAIDKKVLFLRYEDLKKDISFELKKMANFLGFPFSIEEEENGVIEEIVKLCSFENLKNLEINKKGEIQMFHSKVKSSSFFRKGEVGDWKNYLTFEMADGLEKLMEEKFDGSGFTMEMK